MCISGDDTGEYLGVDDFILRFVGHLETQPHAHARKERKSISRYSTGRTKFVEQRRCNILELAWHASIQTCNCPQSLKCQGRLAELEKADDGIRRPTKCMFAGSSPCRI